MMHVFYFHPLLATCIVDMFFSSCSCSCICFYYCFSCCLFLICCLHLCE